MADTTRVLAAWFLVSMCCFGAETDDNFSNGAIDWSADPETKWAIVQTLPETFVYRADIQGDALARKTDPPLDTSWMIDVDTRVRKFYAERRRGIAGLALFPDNAGVQFEADLDQINDGSLRIALGWFDATTQVWHHFVNVGWITGWRVSAYHLQLIRFSGSDRVSFAVSGTNGFSFRANSPPFPAGFLDKMAHPGLRANYAQVDFSNFRVTSPIMRFDIAGSSFDTSAGFRLKIIPASGWSVRIESSTNLTDWNKLAEFENATGPLELIDSSAVDFQRRFYRAIPP